MRTLGSSSIANMYTYCTPFVFCPLLDTRTHLLMTPYWSTSIVPPPPAFGCSALRSDLRRASRSLRRLRTATAAVGNEALRTARRRSRFGARIMSGSRSRSGPVSISRAGERARLRLHNEEAVLSLSWDHRRNAHLSGQPFFPISISRAGEGTYGSSSITILPSAAIPSSTSMPTPVKDPSGSGSASIAAASASPKSPSRTNGTPSALTICAFPVVSAPGATCPPVPGIVDGTCAVCCAGGSEKKGIFWWFQSMRT